jgi:hypothetical protein
MGKGFIFLILIAFNFLLLYGINQANILMFNNNFMIYLNPVDKPVEPTPVKEDDDKKEEDNTVVDTKYNGENYDAIGKKIDKYCKKTPLEGYGEYIAKTSINKGVNPYLISGILLESTNCKIECSVIFKECNNATGMKGSPGCFGGAYKKYEKIEDSIYDVVNLISKDYYTKEMQAPYKMYKTYGRNSSWALKVSNFMDAIKRTK